MLDVVQIIYQDASFALLRKPANLHTLSLKKSEASLISEIARRFPDLSMINGDLAEKSLLQRLDFETSGIVLLAKTPIAFELLKEQFRKHQVTKVYYALVDGHFQTAKKLCGYLGSRYRSSKKASFSENPQTRFLYAQTEYQPVKYFSQKNITLVKALSNYGRRHQVRLMAATLGHPLCGDSLYGSRNSTAVLFPDLKLPTFLLEANQLDFIHPHTQKNISHTGQLPDYLVKLMQYDNT